MHPDEMCKQERGENTVQKRFQNLSKDKIFLALIVGVLLFILSFPLETLDFGRKTGELDAEQELETEHFLETRDAYKVQLEQELEDLLGNVKGAGRVKVMLVLKDYGEKIAEKDQQSESSIKTKGEQQDTAEEQLLMQETTVLENGEIPWVAQELLPQVAGVAVAAEGGGNAVVQSEISSMFEALFGLPAHKIKILEGHF